MEIFKGLFRKPVVKKNEVPLQKEVPSRKEGYLVVDRERVIVPSETPIWICGDNINGEIPGTTIGLIETSTDPITLLIGDPAKYLVTRGGSNLRRDTKSLSGETDETQEFEFWTNGAESMEEEGLGQLNSLRQDAIIEQNQSAQRMKALTEQLTRLQAGQADQATKVLSDFESNKKRAEETVRFHTECQDEEERKLDSIIQSAAKQLTIRSLNGDIELTIQDPSLEVVISDEFNHRDVMRNIDGGESFVVRGKAPLSPARKVSVFAYRGKISVSYPDRHTESVVGAHPL